MHKKDQIIYRAQIPKRMDPKVQYKTWGKSRSNRLGDYDYSADQPIHVTICTENKQEIFNSKINAEAVVGELLKTANDLGFRILCYCLMPDHLHVVLTPANSGHPLSEFLNLFKGRTSSSFWKREGLKKIWQRSAFDHILRRGEDLRATIEYILNNPVRKGIKKEAKDYPYSKWFDEEVERYL